MNNDAPSYHGYRFPSEIISHAIWLYHRFCLSFRDVEDLLAERGIQVSYETIRQWCRKFGPEYARRLKRRQGRLGDTWHLDELFVNIRGQQHYLWRAVDQVRRFKSSAQAQRFLSVHGITRNLFRVGRHLLRAANQRTLRATRVRTPRPP